MSQELSDEQLLCAYFRGDARAFDEFFGRHGGRVLAYLCKKGMREEDAKEVLQEVFLKLHRFIHGYREGSPALPWFFTIVHNTYLDTIKQAARRKNREQVIADATGDNVTHDSDLDVPLVSFSELDLGALSEDQRMVLELRVSSGLSFCEISKKTGKSEPALRKAYERAIGTLRKSVGNKNEE